MASIAPNQTTYVSTTILPVMVPVPATLPVPTPTPLGQDTYVSSVAPRPVAAATPAPVASAPAPGLFDRLHQLMQQLTSGAAPTPAQTPPAPAPDPKPAPKADPKPDPTPAAVPTYTVQSGDSLSAIAQQTLGNANRWHEIFDLNRDTISNPDLIQPGQVLKLPGGSAPAPAPAPATGGTYTVQPGDSLSSIAQDTLGDANRWHEIYDLNRDKISNPDVISAGQVLTLPGGAHAPAPAPAASGTPVTDRSRIYLHQPNGWTCGPTSLTMAAAAFGLRPSNTGTVDELVKRSRCNPNDGIPDSDAIPDAARQIGLNATHLSSSSPSDVRAALERGHGVVYNGSLGSGGHFIYVAGLNPDGSFIICDPWRPDVTRMNDQQLNAFGHTNGHSGSMVEVWK